MIQANRDSPAILEPLLKCLIILGSEIETDEQASCADMVDVIRKQFSQGNPNTSLSLLKVCIHVFAQLKTVFPQAKDVLLEMVASYHKTIVDKLNEDHGDQNGLQIIDTSAKRESMQLGHTVADRKDLIDLMAKYNLFWSTTGPSSSM